MAEVSTQVLIVGGGTGGIAAALALGARGVRCVVTESHEWIGGQLTSQAVPPDENQWVETFGATRRYQSFRERVRGWYREHRSLTRAARENKALNPGGGWVSHLCASPRVMHEVLLGMLGECKARPGIYNGVEPVSVERDGDRLTAVTFGRVSERGESGLTVRADYILDGTELGDLYELGRVEHAIGAEHRDDFAEMHGRTDKADPMDQQAFSWCFALEHCPGEDNTIEKPREWEFWRHYVPKMDPPWCGPLFSWTVPTHNVEGKRTFPFIPWPDRCPEGMWDMWRYRRIVDASIYEPPAAIADVCLVNWVQMDYWLEPLLGVDAAARRHAMAQAKEQSLNLLYWMQTSAPRVDGGTGFPGLKLAGAELGTRDGFAMAPYIREPRRLKARTIVTEAHIGTDQRRAEGRPNQDVSPLGCAEAFEDSVGIGHYTLDLHPSTSGRNSVYVPAAPFRIPLGALIPVRVRNLIAAGKGIGVTHITNGCYRMHHTEWNIGESAGVLAAFCLGRGVEPAQVHESRQLTEELQRELVADGVRIAWPWEK
ncbi:MAG: FAD-dependent oxidoreductase [Planctomycetes bacterium]|nr:FAD-dependent oxidoreductase [Planctomycetota bacterium]